MQRCKSPRMWKVLKECVIEHEYYEEGDIYYETHPLGDKTYLDTLVEHGFLKFMWTRDIEIVDHPDPTPISVHVKGYNIHIQPE